jgi:hypothetical protein
MKHLYLFPLIIFSVLSSRNDVPPMPNPASAYCAFLGYKEVIRKDSKGNEYGVCIFPDGTECEEWQFFRGQCGQKYSYCSGKGCKTYSKTEDKGSYTVIYCECGCLDSLGREQLIPLGKFMEQNGDTLIKTIPGRKGIIH